MRCDFSRISGHSWGTIALLILSVGCNNTPNDGHQKGDPQKAVEVAIDDESQSSAAPPIVEPNESNGRSESTDQRLNLSISFPGIVAGKGDLRIAVYGDAASFNKPDQALMKEVFTSTTNRWEAQLDTTLLKDNRLGIAVYLDANGNGVLDKNTFGIPTELYGFSKNPKRGFGPPRFDDVAVTKNADVIELEIQLH
jgi:uncharacterized protein (DUF2141 family)